MISLTTKYATTNNSDYLFEDKQGTHFLKFVNDGLSSSFFYLYLYGQ